MKKSQWTSAKFNICETRNFVHNLFCKTVHDGTLKLMNLSFDLLKVL